MRHLEDEIVSLTTKNNVSVMRFGADCTFRAFTNAVTVFYGVYVHFFYRAVIGRARCRSEFNQGRFDADRAAL